MADTADKANTADKADKANMADSQKAGKKQPTQACQKQLADLAKRSLKTETNQASGGTP